MVLKITCAILVAFFLGVIFGDYNSEKTKKEQ
ncbi:hypothetical protein ACUXCC_003436 [Cytobacillus horneckiae]